jgi:hypothetical protein
MVKPGGESYSIQDGKRKRDRQDAKVGPGPSQFKIKDIRLIMSGNIKWLHGEIIDVVFAGQSEPTRLEHAATPEQQVGRYDSSDFNDHNETAKNNGVGTSNRLSAVNSHLSYTRTLFSKIL